MIAPETPNQLATDRATLAQEEEDAVQQQDNDDIGNNAVITSCQCLLILDVLFQSVYDI